MKSAVLFLVFNRPDTTRKVFEAIQKAKPPRLYIAGDGPRAERVGERELTDQVRKIATNINWPCEIKTLFRETNLGCKVAVSSAISWFFDAEPEGIILEDDCVPKEDFFLYCDELLERYRDDQRIGLISGTSLTDLRRNHLLWGDEDYVLTRYPSIWGWATWRRVWRDYDVTIEAWPRRILDISALTVNPKLRKLNKQLFDKVWENSIDTWDYQVSFMLWITGRLSIAPRANLVGNIGFGPEATHTTEINCDMADMSRASDDLWSFPLIAPAHMMPNFAYQQYIENTATRSALQRVLERLRQYVHR